MNASNNGFNVQVFLFFLSLFLQNIENISPPGRNKHRGVEWRFHLKPSLRRIPDRAPFCSFFNTVRFCERVCLYKHSLMN
jgi:hypothetical protein